MASGTSTTVVTRRQARPRLRSLLTWPPLTVALAAGCGVPDLEPRGQDPCPLGATNQCACVDGTWGVQHCDAERAAYGPCECQAGTAPAASFPGQEGQPTGDGTEPAETSPDAIGDSWYEPEDDPAPPPEPEPEPEPEPPPLPPSDDVPSTEHCAPVASWDPVWAQWEEEVLVLVNERRAQGASCGSEGTFGPAAPLTMNPILRCAARLHSMDMGLRNFFSHTNPDGLGPFQRTALAGYSGSPQGENIAAGQTSPAAVVAGWMGSDGHCANIMRASFTEIGVGYYFVAGSRRGRHLWTQKFGGSGGGNRWGF